MATPRVFEAVKNSSVFDYPRNMYEIACTLEEELNRTCAVTVDKEGIRFDEWRELKKDLIKAKETITNLNAELAIVKEELAQFKTDNGIFGAGS